MRALVPVAVGVTAGGGFTFRWWLQQVVSDLAANAAVVVGRELILQQVLDNIDWQPLIIFSWYLGSLVICWELRNDILEVLRITATFLLWCLGYLIWFWTWLSSAGYLGTVLDHPTSAREIIGRTTMTDGSDWVWTVIKVTGQGLKASVAGANGRTPPPFSPGKSIGFALHWMPKSLEAPGPTMVFLVDVVVMVCGFTEDEAFSILDVIVCTKGALIYKHKGKWLCGDHSATSHVIMLPLTSKNAAGQHCESVIRMEVAAAFSRYLSSCH